MRFRSYMAAGAAALMPVLAIAGQAAQAPAAQPVFVNVDGQAVPVKADTRVVQTALGPMKVSTWSWHSPHGGASFEMQTSSTSGDVAPATAWRQMQAAQAQMAAMQQMMALQHAALANLFAMPAPQAVGFAMPMWAMPEPVVVIVPAQPSTRSVAPAPSAPARPAARGPEIKA
ncbi:hypothetical protein WJ24_16165 [Burkholderia vietnamiensis]|uniref:hypothetical protein n=1 Tax=Burkholderia vietnamiensis TaxID=60552 RepID=UPI000753BA2E|nr:hypothetical protein [Burkholderia vietnamiensis]KVG08840.1 hypothetical protein WJ24_16165 [Burkholderia vietnamiensis]